LAIQVSANRFEPCVDTFAGHVIPQDIVSRESANMRDSGAHLTRADDADRLDLDHSISP
jgi:hypothetical protein